MEFDYFYGRGADQFAFYQIPKILITDEKFAGIMKKYYLCRKSVRIPWEKELGNSKSKDYIAKATTRSSSASLPSSPLR